MMLSTVVTRLDFFPSTLKAPCSALFQSDANVIARPIFLKELFEKKGKTNLEIKP